MRRKKWNKQIQSNWRKRRKKALVVFINSIEKLENKYEGIKIVTGSFNLFIRGLIKKFDDVDFIVSGLEEIIAVSGQMDEYIFERLYGPKGTLYEVRLRIDGTNMELWRETGGDYAFQAVVNPLAYEALVYNEKLLMLRPLQLLVLDYTKAAKENDPESILKRECYKKKRDLIKKYLGGKTK